MWAAEDSQVVSFSFLGHFGKKICCSTGLSNQFTQIQSRNTEEEEDPAPELGPR